MTAYALFIEKQFWMRHFLLTFFLLLSLSAFSQSAKISKHGSVMQLSVDGKPFVILGGELGNSSASCPEDIERIFPKLQSMNLNTVLVPAYWDLLEPTEGKFDFSLIDKVIDQARTNNLKVVFLWFGAWKNSMSCYAPAWFKKDTKRFPRAVTKEGKPLEIASAFSENVFQADKKAFCKWLSHVKAKDHGHNTVIMIQIENEIGMLESARDYSDEANKAFAEWQKSNPKDAAVRESDKDGALADGSNLFVDERFMASVYAKYVERLAKEARKIYNIPLYVNAAMNSRGRKPGEYPSAGPLAHLMDIWKTNAPSIDIMAPDLYDSGYKDWVRQYAQPNNTLFIPEIRLNDNCGAKAFYAFGHHSALGFSPFSIEDYKMPDAQSTKDEPAPKLPAAYACLKELSPILLKHQGSADIDGFLFDQQDKETTLKRDGLTITAKHFFTLPWDPRATDGSTWPEAGGMIIKLADLEYIIAGTGFVVTFEEQLQKLGEDGFADKGGANETKQWKKGTNRIGILSCDQVSVNPNGSLKYIRRFNGDQDHQGRHVRVGVDDYQILHVKLYKY